MRTHIAKHLFSVLSTDAGVSALVGNNLYPVATKVEKAFPLILYERDTAVSRYSKDGNTLVEVEATVFVLTEDYTPGIELAEKVISALDGRTAVYAGDFAVLDCEHTGSVEGYQDGAFIQQEKFKFIVKSN